MMADDGTEGAWARRTLRLPPDLDRAVAVAAAGAGVAEAELIRQLVRRGLAQRAGASASPEIAAEVDTLLERRLAPLQRLLWVTAWQAASVHARVRDAHIDAMLERLGGDGRDERFLTKRAAADRRAARSAAAWVRVAATAAAVPTGVPMAAAMRRRRS
jgi:hypothetical protein